MRATINDLLGQLGDKNTTEEKRDHHDGGSLLIAFLLSKVVC
jgi:hypothetical protein